MFSVYPREGEVRALIDLHVPLQYAHVVPAPVKQLNVEGLLSGEGPLCVDGAPGCRGTLRVEGSLSSEGPLSVEGPLIVSPEQSHLLPGAMALRRTPSE